MFTGPPSLQSCIDLSARANSSLPRPCNAPPLSPALRCPPPERRLPERFALTSTRPPRVSSPSCWCPTASGLATTGRLSWPRISRFVTRASFAAADAAAPCYCVDMFFVESPARTVLVVPDELSKTCVSPHVPSQATFSVCLSGKPRLLNC